MRSFISLGVLAVLFILVISFAEGMKEELESVFSLFSEEEMVYTSSKYLQPISQSPSTITVITAEEIRQSGATTIPEILRMVPGMEVMQASSAQFNVSIRGNNTLNVNKILVLIDGRSIEEKLGKTIVWVDMLLPLRKSIE